jgi:hypothetical protein
MVTKKIGSLDPDKGVEITLRKDVKMVGNFDCDICCFDCENFKDCLDICIIIQEEDGVFQKEDCAFYGGEGVCTMTMEDAKKHGE